MRKRIRLFIVTAMLFFTVGLFGGCALSELGNKIVEKGKAFWYEVVLGRTLIPPSAPNGEYFIIETAVKYGGEADEGVQTVQEDCLCTLRAFDTEEYAFWFWELNGEPVSFDAEYTFPAKANEFYYAVFKPKASDKVLINVVYDKDDFTKTWYEGIGVVGGGYQTKGQELCLASDGELPVSCFERDGERTNGPSLTLCPDKNETVVVTFENVCEIVLKETPNCKIWISEGGLVMKDNDRLEVRMGELGDGYVADYWTVKSYPTPQAQEQGFDVNEYEYGVNWGKDWAYETLVSGIYRKLEISLSVTNENLGEPYQVEVVKDEGIECSYSAPKYFIQGKETYSGYYMSIYPSENAYIKDVAMFIKPTNSDGVGSRVNAFHGEYAGGLFHISDCSQFVGYDITVRIVLVSRETHALVNLISLDDDIEYTPDPNGGYAPSITTQTFVAEKGVSKEFYMDYKNNFAKIYSVGYQFSHIADEDGNVISETVEFAYAPTEDVNLYIHYCKKPVADAYFDYRWSEKGDGYEVRLSQLSILPYSDYEAEFQEELRIPETYNGSPVVEIPDFGVSYYQISNNGMRDGYGAYVYKTLYVPASVKRIGEKAFANSYEVKIVLEENAVFEEISPDAFYSKNNAVRVQITEDQLEQLVKELHERYIGDASAFEVRFEPKEHFETEGTLGHYEGFAEYICIRKDDFDFNAVSPYDISKLYHEFAHHYQIVATMGVGKESLETLLIKPTEEEIELWKTPYDSEDPNVYWTHPLEVSARAFAKEWSGYNQG